jgi:hypothetical protein
MINDVLKALNKVLLTISNIISIAILISFILSIR